MRWESQVIKRESDLSPAVRKASHCIVETWIARTGWMSRVFTWGRDCIYLSFSLSLLLLTFRNAIGLEGKPTEHLHSKRQNHKRGVSILHFKARTDSWRSGGILGNKQRIYCSSFLRQTLNLHRSCSSCNSHIQVIQLAGTRDATVRG